MEEIPCLVFGGNGELRVPGINRERGQSRLLIGSQRERRETPRARVLGVRAQ